MKMVQGLAKVMTVASLVVAFSMSASAAQPSDGYVGFCGSKAQLVEYARKTGGTVTATDLKDLSKRRAPVLDVLANGKDGLDRLLAQGSKDSMGGFNVLAACGVLQELAPEIKESGCYDLKTNKPVFDKGGIAICVEIMKRANANK